MENQEEEASSDLLIKDLIGQASCLILMPCGSKALSDARWNVMFIVTFTFINPIVAFIPNGLSVR